MTRKEKIELMAQLHGVSVAWAKVLIKRYNIIVEDDIEVENE